MTSHMANPPFIYCSLLGSRAALGEEKKEPMDTGISEGAPRQARREGRLGNT